MNDLPKFPVMRVPVAKGTEIHIAGIPFTLCADTLIDGHRGNIAMLRSLGLLPLPVSQCEFPDGEQGPQEDKA